jgi:hypothetical protein
MIGDQHLVMGIENQLIIFKIDYKLWKVKYVSTKGVHLREFSCAIDQLNKRFLLYCEERFVICSLVDDKVVDDEFGWSNLNNFEFVKFAGNHLYGFRKFNSIWKFYKIDLKKKVTEQRIDTQIIWNDVFPNLDLCPVMILFF